MLEVMCSSTIQCLLRIVQISSLATACIGQPLLTFLYGAPFVKILYLTDLAQKLLSLAEIAISFCRDVISARDSYLSFFPLFAPEGAKRGPAPHL